MSPLWERIRGFDASLAIVDGHDLDAIRTELLKAGDRLTIIFLETVKGKGVSFLENRMDSHYLPLTPAQYEAAMHELSGA